jgi:hypothetical protein
MYSTAQPGYGSDARAQCSQLPLDLAAGVAAPVAMTAPVING